MNIESPFESMDPMQHARRSLLSTVLALAAAAVFVIVTSAGLPEVVASHFDASGVPNGFMPRPAYVAVTLAIVVGVPLLLMLPLYLASSGSGSRLNLPNKGYWLGPERRAETVAYLRRQAHLFSVAVCMFASYVHWLVVGANGRQPPQLSSSALRVAVAVLLAAMVIWLAALYRHFKRGV